jgi:hypothetical protein
MSSKRMKMMLGFSAAVALLRTDQATRIKGRSDFTMIAMSEGETVAVEFCESG